MAAKRRERSRESTALRIEHIAAGQQAQVALVAVREESLNIQDEIVESAISDLSNGALTPERAKEHFCKIAGLRRLIQGLEAKARIGQQTLKRDIEDGTS